MKLTLKMEIAVLVKMLEGLNQMIQFKPESRFYTNYVCVTDMVSANSTMSSSWIYYQGFPGSSISQNRSQQTSPGSQLSPVSSVDFIENERSLSHYLQDYENFERTAAVGKVFLWNILMTHIAEYIKIIFEILRC